MKMISPISRFAMNDINEENIVKLLYDFETAHQQVKLKYLAWAPRQPGIINNGVGSENNTKTGEWLSSNRNSELKLLLNTKNQIITASRDLDFRDQYRLMREVYFIHPSFHEYWWMAEHFNHDRWSILHHSRFGLDKLVNWLDSDNVRRIKGSATFLARYTLLLENLLSSKLKISLLDAPIVDEKLLKDLVYTTITSWDDLTINEVVEQMPNLFTIVHTLLSITGYQAIKPENLLKEDRWLIWWAQCSVNKGPFFRKTSNLTRINIFENIPSLDQNIIREHLRKFFTVSCDDYYRVMKLKL